MGYFILKSLFSGLLVATISTLAKKYSAFAAMIASLPLTSILAFIWFYHEEHNTKALLELSNGIALLVIPSIIFFIVFSLMLKREYSFYLSLLVSSLLLISSYYVYAKILKRWDVLI